MVLRDIDKTVYNRHVKITFIAIAVVLSILSISVSSLLIALLSTPEESHFRHNLAGVIIGAIIVVVVLLRLRGLRFLAEVVFVWDLNQALNRIYRKHRVLEQKAEENDPAAMRVLMFQYRGSKQLYELDDNTVTIEDLLPRLKRLQQRMHDVGLASEVDELDMQDLKRF